MQYRLSVFFFVNCLIIPPQSDEHDKRGHAKFTNYKFDVDEFVKLVKVAEEYVLEHESFPGVDFNMHDEL